MAKRKSLDAVEVAARAKEAHTIGGLELEDVETRTTGINLPSDIHALLRAVALKRAKEMGGRPSVSGILVGLVRQHQEELEDEAGRYLELLDLL